MDKQQFIIANRQQLETAFRCAAGFGFEKPYVVEVKALTRTDQQNKLLHSMFGDLESQAKWNGEHLTLEQWKLLMISAHTIATKEPAKLTIGIEGEVVNLRERSSRMSVARLNSLIEYIAAWGTNAGVSFRGIE